MSGRLVRFFEGLLGRRAETEDADARPSAAQQSSVLADVDAQSVIIFSFNYDRALSGIDVTDADHGMERVLSMLGHLKVRAAFQCPAHLADTAPAQVVMIRDAGHEIVCHGYAHESLGTLTDDQLARLVLRCREEYGIRGIEPLGFHPPGHVHDSRLPAQLAVQGFRFVTELEHKGRPRLLATRPNPIVRMPIASNDSGYMRHPDDPQHVYAKHRRLIDKYARHGRLLALNYHVWMLGDRKERIEDVVLLIEEARKRQLRICTFSEALPARFLPVQPRMPETSA
ncbi:MAG: polysaccharide deacetylase family protein [Phycisphaerae bacterium]|nr:polysaccharide deacetylase family protein [Phycisphaerae bacterium]NUQ45647.1 polysaccharide deacetylase family protein [Phycisphaerae bacterium]